ncbi:MAG: efflux RND transporter periplasmic adaptor subunit [Sinobacteraceae bacterium]|nr:efflux RND transporter periplasmic adaptor subunit [Nevskiaceae bacterium]MCP5472965.1 efflux RND transporter periplasmic adaptor subunit [Nevskiaceae bacterium]
MNDDTASRGGASTANRLLHSRILQVALILLLAFGAWKLFRHFFPAGAGDLNVYATVERGSIEDLVTATGALQPRDYVDVGAQVSGQLRRIFVDVGSEVQQGDLLAEIDAEQSIARVDASRAQLRSQQAQLLQREADLEKAGRDFQRQQNLMKEDATSASALQDAQTTLETTRAAIAALKAQMQQLQASMRVEEANLKYTKIYAPMAGTVVSITARQGQTLNTNQQAPTILRIADLSTMTVQTQVSEADVGKLREGMSAYFTTLGSQGRRWYGTLRKIEPTPTVTNNVVLYNALFDVPNPNRSLLTQMTAQVFFVVAEARDVLVVPMSALTMQRPQGVAAARLEGGRRAAAEAQGEQQRPRGERRQQPASAEGGGADAPAEAAGGSQGRSERPRRSRPATVQLAQAGGSLVTREVQVGVSNRVHAEIVAGLEEGDRIVAGQRQLESESRSSGSQLGRGAAAGGFGPPMGIPGGR